MLLGLVTLVATGAAPPDPFRVAAYLPEYRTGGIDWSVIGSRATDVILFSVEPAPDGTIAHQDRLPPDVLKKARAARDAHGVRLAACVGGAGRSSHFGLVKNPALRKRFGRALLAFAEVEQLDSLDIDWEGQVGEEEDEALAKLLGGIRKAAKKTLPQLTVSVTVHPGDYYAKSFKVASFVHLMSYDSCAAPGVTCRHATFDTAKSHVQRMLTAGLPKRKLVLGIPAYGRSMKTPQQSKTYEEIVRELGPLADDADEAGDWYFNGAATVARKTTFAKTQGLGGVFFWEAGQDTAQDESSLVVAARAALAELEAAEARHEEEL